jgi:hypothetical protein
VRAVDLDGARLLDVLVRLVGARAHHVPAGAIARQAAMPEMLRLLVGRRLVMWGGGDLDWLRQAASVGDDTLPRWHQVSEISQPHLPIPEHVQAVAVKSMATRWRGQLDPHTHTMLTCLAPGAPDRLLLMLRRIAQTPPAPDNNEAAGQPTGAGAPAAHPAHAAPAGRP